jgi:hypothetical protein
MLDAAAPHITETGPLKHAAKAINWLHTLAAEFFAKGTTHQVSHRYKRFNTGSECTSMYKLIHKSNLQYYVQSQ